MLAVLDAKNSDLNDKLQTRLLRALDRLSCGNCTVPLLSFACLMRDRCMSSCAETMQICKWKRNLFASLNKTRVTHVFMLWKMVVDSKKSMKRQQEAVAHCMTLCACCVSNVVGCFSPASLLCAHESCIFCKITVDVRSETCTRNNLLDFMYTIAFTLLTSLVFDDPTHE